MPIFAQRRQFKSCTNIHGVVRFFRSTVVRRSAFVTLSLHFLKSSTKKATVLRLTSTDSKCNIFLCVYSDISIRFSSFFLHLAFPCFRPWCVCAFLRWPLPLIFFHRFRLLHSHKLQSRILIVKSKGGKKTVTIT